MSVGSGANDEAAVATATGPARSVTAFFDRSDDAAMARRDLIDAGIPEANVILAGGRDGAGVEGPRTDPRHHGFWDSIKDFFLSEEDRYAHAEALRRGIYTVAVRTDEANYDEVIEILDRDGAVDMDQREASWRGEGQTGPDGGSTVAAAADAAESPVYQPASDATAGFTGSSADRLPAIDGPTSDREGTRAGDLTPAPRSDAPGSRVGKTTDTEIDEPESAYAPEIDKLNPAATTATPPSAYPAAAPGLGATDDTGTAGVGRRDTAHGRSRIRSYVFDTSSRPSAPGRTTAGDAGTATGAVPPVDRHG